MKNRSSCWNEALETASPGLFREVQETALHKQLDYLWRNSVFYQQKFARAGIQRKDIGSLDDLQRLPFTEKHELRDSQQAQPPFGLHIACAGNSIKRVYSTSGTSGRPTHIGLTDHDIDVWREIHCRALWTCGLRPDGIVPLVVSPFVIAATFADALQQIGTLVPIGVGATDRLISAFRHIGANALLCTTSFPMHFAEALLQRGIDPKSLGLKLIMGGGEPGASIPSVREQIERTFDCKLMDMAGNGDICGLIWAECEYQQGMHFIGHGIVHPEIIDPVSDEVQPIEAGVTGELVYTSLDRECIPLVRFRSRDQALVTRTDCKCGRTGYAIRIIGRIDDMIIVQGVNVYPTAVREVIAGLAPRTTGAIEIQICEPPPQGWKPPVHIKVEHGENPGDLSQLARELEGLIREKLIFRSKVTLVPPDTLPKYEYKARLVRKLYDG